MLDHPAGLTDLCLCVVSASMGVHAVRAGWANGGAGLLLLGAAAGLGAIRFSLSPAVSPVHELAVWMATTVGMPLIGADYVRRIRPMIGPRGVGVLVVLAGVAGSPYGHSAYATVAAAAAMVGVLASSVWIFSPAGIAGALGVLSAGLALRPVCEALAVPFVPAYHLSLVVSAALLWRGLVSSQSQPSPKSEPGGAV